MAMKYAVWSDRMTGAVDPLLDRQVRLSAKHQGFELPKPVAAWQRETGHRVELCSEYQPGYRPIWLWAVN